MSYTNGIVRSPVIVDSAGGDIGSALGLASGDLGTLIQDGNVNCWAKYKPVRYATYEETGLTAGSQWWKGTDGQCGFTIPQNSSMLAPSSTGGLFYKLLHSSLLWTYNKPTGGVSQPFRALDFDGYKHAAVAPIEAPSSSMEIMLTSGGDLTVNYPSNRGDAYSLQLSDFTVNNTLLSQWYFGLLIYISDSLYTFAAPNQLTGGDTSITFTGMTSFGGRTAQIVPFLSSVAVSQGITANGNFISANAAPTSLVIRAYTTGITTDLDAIWENSLYVRIHYTVNLINVLASSITVANMVIALYRSDAPQTVLASRTVSSVTVAAGGNQSYTGYFTPGVTYDGSLTYYIVVTSDNNVASGQVNVDPPRTS